MAVSSIWSIWSKRSIKSVNRGSPSVEFGMLPTWAAVLVLLTSALTVAISATQIGLPQAVWLNARLHR